MQSNKTISIDARTFPEIWETLSAPERSDLRVATISKIRCSDVTFYNWAKGATSPMSYPVKREVASVIKSTLGITVPPNLLFPR